MPKVSVLMPVYNSRSFLRDALESILAQSFKDFEFIIVDDGSIDGSTLLLEEYASKDSRIKIRRNQKNMGIVYSLNLGLKACRGDYIARMDSDDIAINNRLERLVNIMDTNLDLSVLGSALSYIDATGKELGVIRYCHPSARLFKSPLLHPTVMMRKNVLMSYGLRYEERYRFAEDYFLWLQLYRVSRISATNEVLLKYRINRRATKVEKLKNSLWATLKVKKDAILILRIIPNIKEALRMAGEAFLLLFPSRLILFLYLKLELKGCKKVNL